MFFLYTIGNVIPHLGAKPAKGVCLCNANTRRRIVSLSYHLSNMHGLGVKLDEMAITPRFGCGQFCIDLHLIGGRGPCDNGQQISR